MKKLCYNIINMVNSGFYQITMTDYRSYKTSGIHYGRRKFNMAKRGINHKSLRGSCFSFEEHVPIEILGIMDFSSGKDYYYEIINSAMNGGINYDMEFNQCGFVAAIKRNQRMSEKNAPLPLIENEGADTVYDQKGVSVNTLPTFDVRYNDYENQQEYEDALKSVQAMSRELFKTYRVNIKVLLQNALNGVPEAVIKLKQICKDYELFAEQLEIILKYGNLAKAL